MKFKELQESDKDDIFGSIQWDAQRDSINVGDSVDFKDGVEMRGTVVSIRGNEITVKTWDSNTGEYVNYLTDRQHCWKN